MTDRFTGQVVVVTGAGAGIGAAVAQAFAREGAVVAVLDLDGAAAARVAAEIGSGSRAFGVAVDVADAASVARAFAVVRREAGEVNVLVNVAGITRPAPFPEMTAVQWDRVLDVDLRGSYLCAQQVMASFRERRAGKIVNFSSSSVSGARPGRANYLAAKLGVVGLTRSLALELAPFGVNVNAIAPASIETPMTVANTSREAWAAQVAVAPMGRNGVPDDVVGPVLFLASDEARYVTGQCLYVCGGRSIAGIAK